ncbi:MAG: T9SS type A sorting domain-containing protein [Flavobacteriales bacterium]|nr:T9SS type A sorting domain-containing protein [Flavobacteriales bacterium]
MKKAYLFIFGITALTTINAQITLTSTTHVPAIGTTIQYYTDFASTIPMPQSGTNQTWNFSSAGGALGTTNYINLASSVEPATYPSANLVESTSTNAENYYSSNTTDYSVVGQLTPNIVRAIYTNPRETLKFPITYPNVFNETFAGTVENIGAGQTFDRSGTNVISADGYGTLILPYATVNNVLKVSVMGSYVDLQGATQIASYTDTIITFYDAINKVFIASYTVLYVNGALISTTTNYINQADLVTGITGVNHKENNVLIYPNPTSKSFTIKSNIKLDNITIVDITGKVVDEIVPSFNLTQQVNTSKFGPGIYFVKYADQNGTHTQKLIIE